MAIRCSPHYLLLGVRIPASSPISKIGGAGTAPAPPANDTDNIGSNYPSGGEHSYLLFRVY